MKLNWSCIIPLPFQPLDLIILLNLVVVHAIVKKVLYHNDIFSVHGLWKKKQGVLGAIKLLPSKKSVIKILKGVSGIVRPAR